MVYGLGGDRCANTIYRASYFLLVDMHPSRRPKGNNSSVEPDIRQCKEQQEGDEDYSVVPENHCRNDG